MTAPKQAFYSQNRISVEVSHVRCGIGLDLGGSSAKVALVSDGGVVLAHEVVQTPALEEATAVLAPFADAVDRLRAVADERSLEVWALGCGVPASYVDEHRIDLCNIPALNGFALAPWLRTRFGLPTTVRNDACLAAFGEATMLGTAGEGRVLFVTIGSGIGVVLLVGGRIVHLLHGLTGDAGHIIVDHSSPERCPIGCRGCLETVASARALSRWGREAANAGISPMLAALARENGDLSGSDVSRAVAEGDEAAREILRRAGYWLGVGLASWAPIYAPELILLGGGVAQAGDDWFNAVSATFRATCAPFYAHNVVLRRAALGNRAGVVGAALLALEEVNRTAASEPR